MIISFTCIVFVSHKRLSLNDDLNVNLEGKSIESVGYYKYLGITWIKV